VTSCNVRIALVPKVGDVSSTLRERDPEMATDVEV
jgi:hypothetical protein